MDHAGLLRKGASPLLVALSMLVVYVVWGSTYLFIRFAVEGYPPLFFPGVRFVAAGLLMGGVLLLRGHPRPSRRQLRNALLVGMLLLNGGNGFVVMAERSVGSALSATMLGTVPLWTGLFAYFFGHRPAPAQWLGMVVGFAGVVVLKMSGDFAASPAGAVMLLLAAASWALGTVLGSRLDLPKGVMSGAVQMVLAGILFLAGSAAAGEHWTLAAPLRAQLALLYLLLFGSVLAFTAYIYLTQHVSPTMATSYAYVNPIIAALLGVYLGGERFGANDVLAMILVLAGVALILGFRRPRPAPA
ncbi:MAG: drug/metabolite exporter YedA [Nevskia sp.]|nr:drug/metabolite exporter YedA [Nevskia sp.]